MTSTATTTSTHAFTPEQCRAIGMVGQVVTYGNRQWILHSVEGTDWYAFDDQGMTTVDCRMTPANWIMDPIAMLIPSGHEIGDGFGVEVYLSKITRGVCLAKF